MREILFRGRRVDNGEWVEGFYVNVPEHYKHEMSGKSYIVSINNGLFMEVVPETVGEYTGLTDKNGKKIFEGDIVKDEGFEYRLLGDNRKVNRNGIAVVEYGFHDVPSEDPFEWGEAYGFYFNGDTLYPTPARYKPYCEGKGKQFSFEVIGNKWDNPELLEVER